jgi:hypothetical protein
LNGSSFDPRGGIALRGGGNADTMAALTVRRLTRCFSSIARPDIPAARSWRIAANSSIFDIRGIGSPPSRVSRCSHRPAWCRTRGHRIHPIERPPQVVPKLT